MYIIQASDNCKVLHKILIYHKLQTSHFIFFLYFNAFVHLMGSHIRLRLPDYIHIILRFVKIT